MGEAGRRQVDYHFHENFADFLGVIAPLCGLSLFIHARGESAVRQELDKSLESRTAYFAGMLEAEVDRAIQYQRSFLFDKDLQKWIYTHDSMTVIGVRSILQEKTWFGEGEVKFYLDGDDQYPTICGTGLEDYIGSAWGLQPVVTPEQGAPLVDYENALFSLYRFHGKDPIYFRENIRVTLQQIGYGPRESAVKGYGDKVVIYPAFGAPEHMVMFERSDDICSVAYWYQTGPTRPFPPLPSREERVADLLGVRDKGPSRTDVQEN